MYNKIINILNCKFVVKLFLLIAIIILVLSNVLFANNAKITQKSGFTDEEIMAIYNRSVRGIDNIYLKKVIDNKMDVGTPGLWELIVHGKDGDWDHDGIKNIDEIELLKDKVGNLYLNIKSDPFNEDSDFDGIKDAVEIKFGLDPLNYTEDEKQHSLVSPSDKIKANWFQNLRITLSNRFFGVDELSEIDIIENHLLKFLDSEMNGINVEVVDKVATSIENGTELYEIVNDVLLSNKLDEVKIIPEITNMVKDAFKKTGKEVVINRINNSNEILDYLIKNGSRQTVKKAAKNVKKLLSDEKENISYKLEGIGEVAVDNVKDKLIDLLVDKSAEYASKKLAKEALYKTIKDDIGIGWNVGYFIFKKTFKDTIDNATDDALEALLYCDLGNAIFNYYSNLFYEKKVNDGNNTYKYYILKDVNNIYNILDTYKLLQHWLEGHKELLNGLSLKTEHTVELEKEEDNTILMLKHKIQVFELYADKMTKRNEYLKSINDIRNNREVIFDNDCESKIELIYSKSLDNSNKRNVFISKEGKYYYIDINGDLLKNTVIIDSNGFCYESNDKGEVTVSENVAGAWEQKYVLKEHYSSTEYYILNEAIERFDKQFIEDGYSDILFLHRSSENRVKELDIEKKYNELIKYKGQMGYSDNPLIDNLYAVNEVLVDEKGNIWVWSVPGDGGYKYVIYYRGGNVYQYYTGYTTDPNDDGLFERHTRIYIDDSIHESISNLEFWFIAKKFNDMKENDVLSEQIRNARLVTEYSKDTLVDQIDIVKFGSYPQSDASGNTKEPIEWIVLDRQRDKALLLSKYILDFKCYNDDYKDVTWETCTLRNWLNNDFYFKAFSSDEQKKIQTTNITNNDNLYYGTNGGNNINDKVFCLSAEEVRKYFGKGIEIEYYYFQLDKNVATRGTNYAKNVMGRKGKSLMVYNKSEYSWATGNSWFWLRSLNNGVSPNNSYLDGDAVDPIGGIIMYICLVYYEDGVRPALWVSY